MTKEEEIVLELCRQPRTRWEIAKALDVRREAVTKVIRRLERRGLIISHGSTASRKHT